jgi:glycosyltransferase involved in cell wall biosynthesis
VCDIWCKYRNFDPVPDFRALFTFALRSSNLTASVSTPKRILISVTSDLVTDQRVHRGAATLAALGHQVTLIGRELPNSPPMSNRPYTVKRFRLWFTGGPLFYAAYNTRLLFFLLGNKADVLLANDLDTLFANRLAKAFKRIPLVYDSHEYFTGVPELTSRPFIQKTWKAIERWCLPVADKMMTVNDSIASMYENEYHKKVAVVRNVPLGGPVHFSQIEKNALRKSLGLPEDQKMVVIQGAGINIQRGAEEAVEAMQYINGVRLLVIGGGDVMDQLQQLVVRYQLQDKVIFRSRMPFPELMKHTASADLGLTIDKDTNLNYRFSLPNKLFDYIRAGIPVLASRLPEVEKIVAGYDIGAFIDNHDPKHIADRISALLRDEQALARWKKNGELAARELNWDREQEKFIAVFDGLL